MRPSNWIDGDGRVVHIDEHRGPLIVWDEEEWRSRNSKFFIPGLGRIVVAALVLYFALYTLALWESSQYLDDGATFTFLVEMFGACTISLFIALIMLGWVASLWYAKRPPAGVYLKGVQIPYGEFVTYDRIEDVRRVVKRVVLFSRDDVVLVPRKGASTRRGTDRWRIPFKMVGVEGMVTIGKKVVEERERERKGPAPDLVLYGPAGPGTAVEDRRSERSF